MAEEFIRKLSNLRELGEVEDTALRTTFHRTQSFHKGKAVFTEGEHLDDVYIVKSGWFFSYAILSDGSRQIHEIFTKGDVIGLENLSWSQAMTSLSCAVSGELYTAPIMQLRNLLQQQPKLDHLFRTLQMVHQVLLIDRLTAVSRLDAFNRLAFFLSDALARQNLHENIANTILRMPLSQNVIADCLGLSSVHVSRQFGKLVQDGLISKIDRKTISILDSERLSVEGNYKHRFSSLIKSALPPQIIAFTSGTATKEIPYGH